MICYWTCIFYQSPQCPILRCSCGCSIGRCRSSSSVLIAKRYVSPYDLEMCFCISWCPWKISALSFTGKIGINMTTASWLCWVSLFSHLIDRIGLFSAGWELPVSLPMTGQPYSSGCYLLTQPGSPPLQMHVGEQACEFWCSTRPETSVGWASGSSFNSLSFKAMKQSKTHWLTKQPYSHVCQCSDCVFENISSN